MFTYDAPVTNRPINTDPFSGLYISVSAFTNWVLYVPFSDNAGVDVTQITEFMIKFTGTASGRAPGLPNNCTQREAVTGFCF